MASSLQQYRQELESRNLPSDLIDRMVRSRQKAKSDVALQSGLGERIFDRVLGGASAGGYTIAGGLADLAGGLGGFLGGPFEEDAATLKQFADEAYRRAKPLALEGYKQGSVTASKGAVPMIDLPFYSETEMLANLQDKVKSPEYLGEFGGLDPRNYGAKTKLPASKLSEQEMADILSDVEGKSDLYRQLAEIEDRAKNKTIPDVDFIDPSLAEANREQTKISQDKTTEDEMLAASGALDATYSDRSKDENPTETAFMEAIKQFMADAGKEDVAVEGETRKQKLDRYRKEFEEATGIDASVKIDKSRALMAFGLSLMQNRAGSGFNIGRMLRSVGEAGEAAMPQLDKAIERADAAKLAAGKYALNQIQADENAAAASRASHLEHQRAMDLERLKSRLKAQEKSIEAPETKHPFTQEYTIGAKPLKMQLLSAVEKNPETGITELVTKFQSPETQSTEVLNRYKNAADGFGLAEELKVVLSALDQASANSGGQVFEILKGRGKNLISVLGLTSDNILYDDSTYDYLIEQGETELAEKYKANPTSLENKAEVAQDALMARFKRFMTQETGNGISVYDSEAAKVLTGKIGMFTPLNKNLEYISQLQGLFGHSLDTLDDLVIDLYDRNFYLSQGAYDKTIKKLNDGMKDVYEPLQLSSDSNLTKTLYDVSDK